MSQNVTVTTFNLFLLRGLRMLLSIAALVFSAKYFGVSVQRDAWVFSITLFATLGAAVWGALNETFRAKFIFMREECGEDIALEKTSSLLGIVLIITVVISVLIAAFSQNIAIVISNKLSIEDSGLFMKMILLLLPTFLINQLIALGISILNAYNIFYIPEIVGAITGVLNLVVIVLLAPIIGIYSLAVSLYISIVLLLITTIWFINRSRIQLSIKLINCKFSHVSEFFFFALPFYLPYFVGQLNLFIEKWLAGLLGTGFISMLDYVRQFTTVLQGLLSSVLATLMVPLLAKAFSHGDSYKYATILRDNTKLCFFIMCIALSLLFGAASPLCEFFFLRGDVSAEEVRSMVFLMRIYSTSFIGIMMYIIFGMALLSSKKGNKYALYGVLTQLSVLILNVVLYRTLSVYAFPFSVGVSHLLFSLILFYLLEIDNKKKFGAEILKYIVIILLSSLTTYVCNEYIFVEFEVLITLLYNALLLLFFFPIIMKIYGLNIGAFVRKN